MRVWWLLAWLAGTLLGAAWLAHDELRRLREAFDTDARIIHRLLSQRAVQHDAILATLALRAGPPSADSAADSAVDWQRLGSVYPQITTVALYTEGTGWQPAVAPAVQAAAVREESARLRRAVLADAPLAQGHYWIVQATPEAAHALRIDARLMVPWADWPMPDKGRESPVRVALQWRDQDLVLQPGHGTTQQRPAIGALAFDFRKPLAAQSQPFDVVVTGAASLWAMPWLGIAAVAAAWGGLLLAARAWLAQREARQRAEALLRMGQVARLNTLGELAAGLAHELNQPLTALLASTQAASRLLDEEPADIDTARGAMRQAAGQAQRAAEVLARLRGSIERPDSGLHGPAGAAVDLAEVAGKVLYLLEPELRAAGVRAESVVEPAAQGLRVQADPVAVEQIVHNLVTNAAQAVQVTDAATRRVVVRVSAHEGHGVLQVADSGPGVPADLRPRIFQPFFTTRADGLGLGLSLCESLASGMGGRLELEPSAAAEGGATFRLSLPLGSRA